MEKHPAILGSNHKSIRMRNRSLVLKMICTGTNVTRIDISRHTGLSKMSITNIVDELISEGYVTELPMHPKFPGVPCEGQGAATAGRKPVFLGPAEKFLILGIYISRDYAAATLSDLKCEALYEERCCFSAEETEHTFVDKLLDLAKNALASETARSRRIMAIGVACIGPLDAKNGIMLEPPNFHNIKQIPIADILRREFGLEVFVNNDMKASALAEKLYGWGKNVDNFIYIGVTNGIGSGVIAGNTLFEGDMGFSGEIGHTTINFDGPRCACGNTGCLELYASIPVIEAQARNSIALGMDTALGADFAGWPDIVKHAVLGDKLAVNLIDKMCMYISIGLVSLINIFDPKVIFLGHDIAIAGGLVTERLKAYIKNRTFSRGYKDIPIEISAFGDRTPIAGSAAIVADRLFN